MIGQVVLFIALAAALIAAALFVLSTLKGKPIAGARWAIFAHSGAVVMASSYLLSAFLTHKFQFHYVYANSDSTLAWPFLLSAFWAGQQGSFLFWALCGAIVSLLVMWQSKWKPDGIVMATLAIGQAFLLLFLIQDSPFRLMKNLPLEGLGLNPLLLNPWMIIHPPIIFIAYALLIVPMAYSLSALFKKRYHEDLIKSLPWALLGWLFLGAGILIGGVWAYQVLGWGGYWGWDPVENSSLIPWLTGGALIHGLLVQRKRGGFLRANHFLAITTYLLVIVATYITRSGMMAEYSVHAFAETPLSRWIGLFVMTFSLVGYGLFGLRYRDIGEGDGEQISFFSRPVGFGLTMLLLSVSAGLIMLGTLAPVISGWFGLPATVDSSFYLRTNGPLAAALLVLLGLILVLGRSGLSWATMQDALAVPLLGLSMTIVGAFLLGIKAPLDLVFLGLGAFALLSNLLHLWQSWISRGLKFTGGYLAHIGIALILIGFLVSTNYTKSDTVYMSAGRPVQALGYEFTWLGYTAGGNNDALNIQIVRRNSSGIAHPKMYMVGGQQMREPGIKRNLWQDIYISPIEMAVEFPGHILVQEGRFFTYGEHSIQFSELRQSSPHVAGEAIEVSATLIVRYVGDVQVIAPTLRLNAGISESVGTALPNSELMVYLQAVDPAQGLAWFTIGDEAQPRQELLIAEVKAKPFVSFLALGALLLTLGTGIACWRRFGNA
ncbi:MAG: cytochrome c biogenesis protein CcsA [Bacillota bacterium]|nr:cytochrome c biogenesis protein CcsA [Bacillota bacterium]